MPLTGRDPIIDPTKPSIARVYDAVLNGKDNFEVDRAVRDQVLAVHPESLVVARDNRDWLIRVVRYLTGTLRVDQFLDCGSGLPTAENTHQAAQRINPEARVLYIDNDPVVLAHGRALLEENENTHFVDADIRHPRDWITSREVTTFLDFSRPIALLHVAILHHVLDEEGPYDVLAGYVDRLVSGSYVAISHFHNPHDESEVARVAAELEQVLIGGEIGRGRFRTGAEITRFFDGLELVPPGIALLPDWWPDGPQPKPLPSVRQLMLGGLARKP